MSDGRENLEGATPAPESVHLPEPVAPAPVGGDGLRPDPPAPVATRKGKSDPGDSLYGKPRGRAPSRQRDIRNVQIAKDHTFGRMTHNQLGKKYNLAPRQIRKILSREEIQAIEELWAQNMFDAHRQMGDEALAATLDLIIQRDPITVNQYWKRMGITREPSVEVDVKELKLEVPQPVQELLQRVFRQLPEGDSGQS